MLARREKVSAAQQIQIRLGVVAFYLLANVFDSNHKAVVSDQHSHRQTFQPLRGNDYALNTEHRSLTTPIIAIGDADPKVGVTHAQLLVWMPSAKLDKWGWYYCGVGVAA